MSALTSDRSLVIVLLDMAISGDGDSGFVILDLEATSGALDTTAIHRPPFASAHKQPTRTSISEAFSATSSCAKPSHM